MNNIFDRLKFARHEEVFATREDAYSYVINHQILGDYPTIDDPTKNRPALFGEPMALLYESGSEKDGPNVILAIGSVGDGTVSNKNKTFFIDTKKTEEEISELDIRIDELTNLINLITLESPTIKLNSEPTEDGTIVSGDVKIADYRIVDGKVNRNIIQTEGDKGIYAFVDLGYDDETSTLTFNVNGVSKDIQLPADQHVTKGWYDPKEESIFIKLADGSQVKVLVTKLIEEWTVLPDGLVLEPYDLSGSSVNHTPIVLKKEHVSANTSDHEGIYDWQDVLEADVRVADHISDNILHKDRTGRYLYVKGTADNIIYKDGQTVKEALDTADIKVSTSVNNLIYKRPDGIYASAKLDYNTAENKLIYTYSDGNSEEIKTVEFKLNSVKILDDITYDPTKEVIVIRYIDSQGEYQTVEIPASDIIEEWDVNNEAHNIYLDKFRSQGAGKDILTADAKIHSGDNNILEDLNHELYVNGVSNNIKYDVTGETTVKDVLDELSAKAEDLDIKIEQEKINREGADNVINNIIGSGFTEDPHENITFKFEELVNQIDAETERAISKESELNDKIDAEIERSTSKDEVHDSLIENIEIEIGDGFGPRNTIRDEFNKEKEERENADADLADLIAALSAVTDGKLVSVNNIDHSINVDNTDNVNPVIKVNLSSEVEDNKPNIIKLNNDGLYAGVDLIYEFNEETGSNQLIFKTTNSTKVYDLKTNSVVDKIYYDASREAIIIEYTVNGHRMPDVVIPVGDLINEWRVWDGHEGAVQLEKERIASGTTEKDVLKASVVITEIHDDNILINDNGALYVSGQGIVDNANAISGLTNRIETVENGVDGVKTSVNELSGAISSVESALSNEIQRSTDIDDELLISAATNASNIIAEANRAQNAESNLRVMISDENVRALTAETALENAIANETTRATNSELTLERILNDEISARADGDSALSDSIDAESARAINAETEIKENIIAERNRAISAETALQTNIVNETLRAQNAENTLQEKINGEILARTEKYSELNSKIDQEIVTARATESGISQTLASEISRSTAEDNRISEALAAEVAAREAADDGLEEAIRNATLRFEDTTSIDLTKDVNNLVTARVKVANSDDNIIVVDGEKDGVYGSVKLLYNPGTNKIQLITSAGAQDEIQLNAGALLDSMTYDSVNRALVVTYTDSNGTSHTLNFPVNELFNDWIVNNPTNNSAVELIKTTGVGGDADTLSGRVLLTNLEDNIIRIVNNGLYVSGAEIKTGEEIAMCVSNELKAVERAVFGDQEVGECGEGFEYIAPSDTYYINSAVTVNDATYILDINLNKLSSYTENVDNKVDTVSGSVECLKNELNITQNNVLGMQVPDCGLNDDETEFKYIANSGTNYIFSGTSFNDTDIILDREIKKANNRIDETNINVETLSGNVECLDTELSAVENIMGVNVSQCGIDSVYTPSSGCVISAATSLYNADVLLDNAVCELADSIGTLSLGGDTVTVHTHSENGRLYSDAKLSHGNANGMTDADLTVNNINDFTDTNALRVVDLTDSGLAVNAGQNGLYLSNVWDCGEYTPNGEGTPGNKYQTDESAAAKNFNYMNNVRQSDI